MPTITLTMASDDANVKDLMPLEFLQLPSEPEEVTINEDSRAVQAHFLFMVDLTQGYNHNQFIGVPTL